MKSGTFLARLIALLIPIAALAFVTVLIILPLAGAYEDAATRIDAAQATIARYQNAKARLPALRARAQLNEQNIAHDALLPQTSGAETQAVVQANLQSLLASSGVVPMSSRDLARAERGSFFEYGAELDLRATPSSLARFIAQVEAARPLLRISHLTITTPETGLGPVDDEGQPLLSVRMSVASLSPAR